HRRRKWYWAGMAMLLISGGIFTADYLLNKQPINAVANKLQSSLSATQEAKNAFPNSDGFITKNTSSPNTVGVQVSADQIQRTAGNSIEASLLFKLVSFENG